MYFKQIDEIIRGEKFQTRRIVKPGERLIFDDDTGNIIVLTASGRVKWVTCRNYAVSPGRGKPGALYDPNTLAWCLPGDTVNLTPHMQPLRIVITAIRCERLQDISEGDAMAEGWPAKTPYMLTNGDPTYDPVAWYAQLWDTINTRPGTRWEDNPRVWVIEFEVMR